MKRFRRDFLLVTAGLVLSGSNAAAQDYPSRTVRIIVPQAPGAGPDIVARYFSQKLTESWGQQVIVENRAGANGIIGMEAAAKAKPDGYTLLLGVSSGLTMNPFVSRLSREAGRHFGSAEIRERMASNGSEAVTSTPEAFGAFVKAEAAKWQKVIRSAGLEHSQ